MVDEIPSVACPEFDASNVLDSIINGTWQGDGEVFYSSLLRGLEDEELKRLVLNIKTSRSLLGRASHAVFLLPWALQLSLYQSQIPRLRNENTTQQSQGSQTNLKKLLQKIIARAKAEAQLSEHLLELRLTGFSKSRDLLHGLLRLQHTNNNKTIVVCNFRDAKKKIMWYIGKLVLFDRECNILLTNARASDAGRFPFIFIR